jgi:hypothetical protein
MEKLLHEDRFNWLSADDKSFILAFAAVMTQFGYDCGGSIGSGYCWGRYMIIYGKTGSKSRPVLARIYMRDDGIILRLYLNEIDKHRTYIEQKAPAYIRDVFTGSHGQCRHCPEKPGDSCRFRKSYTLDGRLIEKCNGITFEFPKPDLARLPDYVDLLNEFTGKLKA